MTPGSRPDPEGRGDPGLGRLLRWYPHAWRERYGEEFLAMVEDTLDGRPPGWRLRLAVAGYGLRERGHQARRAGGRVLPGLARGFAGGPGSVVIVAGYLLAILPHELGKPPARQAGVALDVLTALIALAGPALLAGGLAALPALVRLLRAGGRPKVRRKIAWAAGATVTAGAGMAWLTLWSRTSSLDPLNASPAYACGLLATLLALGVALDQWAATAAAIARRLALAPRLRAAETMLGAVAVPAIVILAGADMIWYSVISSSFFWLVWGVWWLVEQGPRVAREIRGRTG